MTKYPFGTDYKLTLTDGVMDVDTTFAVETDEGTILVSDLLKIITTGQGVLWWAPTATEDVSEGLLDTYPPSEIATMQARLKGAIDQDPRLTTSSVQITFASGQMRISISATAADRRISLVVVSYSDGRVTVEDTNGGY